MKTAHATHALVLATLLAGAAPAFGSMLVVDRGLPTDNLNNQASPDRSNVGWDFQGFGYFAGDDFTIAGSGTYRIDQIRFWITPVGGAGANNNADLGDDTAYALSSAYSDIAFYLGEAGDASVPLLAAGSFTGGNATDNPDIAISRVLYSGNDAQFDYQGSSTNYIQLYEVTLSNLSLLVSAGTSYQFGTECRAPGDNFTDNAFTMCFMHASNAALSGSTQDGSDDLYRYFFVDDLSGPAAAGGTLDSDGFGWDKSSDVNIQVWATVPAPMTAALLLSALPLMAAVRRRKRD